MTANHPAFHHPAFHLPAFHLPAFHLPALRLPALRYDHATAFALALTGNFLLLLMLSLPRDEGDLAVVLPAEAPPPIIAEMITRAQPEPIPPPPMPTPPQPRPQPVLRAIVEHTPLPLPTDPVTSEIATTTPTNEFTPTASVSTTVANPPAERGAGVSYDQAPAPKYPGISLRRSDEGTVMLKVRVGTDGRALQVEVAQTSGHRELDRAAQEQVLARWRFIPAVRDGREVEAWVMVPVEFKLSRR